MLQSLFNRLPVHLLGRIDERRILVGINPIGKCVGVLTADIGDISRQSLSQQLGTLAREFPRLLKNVADADGGTLVVQVHQIGEPDNFLVGIIHWRGTQQK